MSNADRNEAIVVAYFDTGGRNVKELAEMHRLDPQDIYDIVAAGGADVPTIGAQPKRAHVPMLHTIESQRRSNSDLFRGGRPAKLKLNGTDLLAAVTRDGVSAVAAAHGVGPATVYNKLNGMGYSRAAGNIPGPKATTGPKPKPEWSGLRASGGTQRRFVGPKSEPDRIIALKPDHPAVLEGRTLFPGSVVGAWESPRFLISGKNNSKIGATVTKGPWAGMPIFMLTLQERATCPQSCAQWLNCYGNSMHLARRNDATDPDFIPALAAEVITLARANPKGFVLRLHILGDFFSPNYVRCWGILLDMLPGLHVYGYTARRVDDPDPLSAAIAQEIQKLNERWDRWAIRTSHTEPGRDRTIVVREDPGLPDVLICPAQTREDMSCGTCGLCWSTGARDKTVAFLLHGMKR